MTCTIYDSPLRWMVSSRTDSAITYLVDIGANNRNGECQCPSFHFNAPKAFAKGQPFRCYHITRARDCFIDWSISKFVEHDKNLPDEYQT